MKVIVDAFKDEKEPSPGTVKVREGTFTALVQGVKDVKDARRRRGEVNIDAEAVSRLDHVRRSSSATPR